MIPCGYEYDRSEIMLIAPPRKRLAFAFRSGIESRDLQDVVHFERSQLANLPRALIFIGEPAADEFPILSAWRISKNRDLLRDTILYKICSFECSRAAGVKRHDDDVRPTNWLVDDKCPSDGSQDRRPNGGNGSDSSQCQRDYHQGAGRPPQPLRARTGFGGHYHADAELQRAETINCAKPYPPKMTAAKLPTTTARRKAAVMAYSIRASDERALPCQER